MHIIRKTYKFKITTNCMEKQKPLQDNFLPVKALATLALMGPPIHFATLAGMNYLPIESENVKGLESYTVYQTRDGLFTKEVLATHLDNPCESVIYSQGVPFAIGTRPFPFREPPFWAVDENGDGTLDRGGSNVGTFSSPNLETTLSRYKIPLSVQQAYADLRESRGLNEYCNR